MSEMASRTFPNCLLQQTTPLKNCYVALRHGQSKANVQGIIASNPATACSQYGLSDEGNRQAEQAGIDIVNYYYNSIAKDSTRINNGIAILASDLLRAKETAMRVRDAVVSSNIPLYTNDIVIEMRLRERGFGQYDGGSDQNYKKVWQDDLLDSSHTKSDVESVDATMLRTTQCILDWETRIKNHLIILVAHGDVLQITQTAFSKLDGSQHRSLEHLETAKFRPLELK